MANERSPVDLPIRLERNGSWSATLLFKDELGAAVDLAGVTFSGSVRPSAGSSTVYATFAFTVVDESGGQVLVSLLGSDFDEVPGTQEIVRLAHDAYAVKDGTPAVIFRGETTLDPEVTP